MVSGRKTVLTIVLILAIILLIAVAINCPFCRQQKQNMNGEKIFLTTSDEVKIAGLYYQATGEKGIVLVHQFGRDKNSWGDLPEFLQQNGWSVLAIDLRGHGESELYYQNFTDADFNNMTLDVEAAIAYLKNQGKTQIDIMGSSIGANLALMEKGKGNAEKVVALSPGLNFKGLDAEKAAKQIAVQKISSTQVFLIAAADDTYSYQSCEMLQQIMDGSSEFLQFSSGGHGVNLFSAQPELKNKIIEFLK